MKKRQKDLCAKGLKYSFKMAKRYRYGVEICWISEKLHLFSCSLCKNGEKYLEEVLIGSK